MWTEGRASYIAYCLCAQIGMPSPEFPPRNFRNSKKLWWLAILPFVWLARRVFGTTKNET